MIDALKGMLLPGSMTAMMTLLLFGVVLLYVKPRWGRVWLTVGLLAYWTLSSPFGADRLARTLDSGYAPLQKPEDARGARAIVVLGGGSVNARFAGGQLSYVNRGSALRALEAVRVYRLLGDPLIIVSGGVTDRLPGAPPESDAYRSAMLALGVPAARIVSESESRNTHEEAVVLKRLLRELGVDRFVLVTSPPHMKRSLAAFGAQGLYPIPSPAPLYADRPREPFLLGPNDAAFEVGNAAVYEWLARAYYWSRGWTRGA
jgi:uncharacterized SAM-binding protein YcdF (DUF218 family)